MNYRDYITSRQWRSLQKQFLKDSGYRCAMFRWIQCGKGAKYHCHHMNYENLGSEQLWRDVVVLSPFAHNFIIHGLLSGFKRPSKQSVYPNAFQQMAHFWCCRGNAGKIIIVLVLMALVSCLRAL